MTRKTNPRILIEVDGGVVQRVVSDIALDVYLIDHDNLKAGDSVRKAREPYTADVVKEFQKEVDDVLRDYRKRRS